MQFLAERWTGSVDSELCRVEGVVQTLLSELRSLPLYEALTQNGQQVKGRTGPSRGFLTPEPADDYNTTAPNGDAEAQHGEGESAERHPVRGALHPLDSQSGNTGALADAAAVLPALSASAAGGHPHECGSAAGEVQRESAGSDAVGRTGGFAPPLELDLSRVRPPSAGIWHAESSLGWEQLCLLLLLVPGEAWLHIADPQVRGLGVWLCPVWHKCLIMGRALSLSTVVHVINECGVLLTGNALLLPSPRPHTLAAVVIMILSR